METAAVLGGALSLAGGMIWLERRLLALWQDRLGPNRVGPFGLLQVAADLIKLLAKEDWVPPFADRTLFVLAPALTAVAALAALAVIPFAPGWGVADLDVGLLFFLGASALGVYGVLLGGWASRSKYALLGSLRVGAQVLSYEVFMGLSLLGVAALAGSFRMSDIVEAQKDGWFVLPQLPGFLVFLVAGIAETRRSPLDLPEAESELVAGFHAEYSGFKFALFFVGEYVGMATIASVAVTCFLGGWRGPLLPPAAWFFIKLAPLLALFILVRAALPRPRYDQLLRFGWTAMLPLALLNLAGAALWRAARA
ncbi:MAG TPA: NADH-quinone oxidoreductase subunit NuoH [Planctomycetota bacterium]|nr:NADH-quinone oxidoreductase subunit NuoH [Planctomycetota bacterium]